jgi:hypothetical protein
VTRPLGDPPFELWTGRFQQWLIMKDAGISTEFWSSPAKWIYGVTWWISSLISSQFSSPYSSYFLPIPASSECCEISERNLVLGANYDNFCSLWIFTFSAFSDVYLNAVAASPHFGSVCTLGPFEQFGRRGWLGSGPTKCQFAPSLTQQPLQSPFWPT